MGALLFGTAALALLIYLARGFLGIDAGTLLRVIRSSAVTALALIAAVLFLRGLFALGLALTIVAVVLHVAWGGWRPFARGRATGTSGPMTRAEALAVLGLHDGASADDIRAAHRRLILQIHPDRGGTDYLAAKINQAKDVLLGK